MATRNISFTTIMIIAAIFVGPGLGTDYLVGDEAGWNLEVDYTKWAKGKDFLVGDTLRFVYVPGSHNTLVVNGPDFKQCTSSNASSVPMTSGMDLITLVTPGKKWYICDIADHCVNGMKLFITVSSPVEQTPAPTPGLSVPTPPGTSAASPVISCVWMLLLAVVVMMMKA